MTDLNLISWREGVQPHQDIVDDCVTESLFAVNLSQAMANAGADEYRDPTLFFERTHLTRTLKSLIVDVLKTLNGEPGANSVIHLQTNFGGGKTHAELALYHLLTSPDQVYNVPRVADFLIHNGFEQVPQAAVAALPCADLYAGGHETDDGILIYTLWGEMAYRLGGPTLYAIVKDSDQRQSSPGVVLLRRLLDAAGPNLIMIDELLHYVDKAAAIRVGDSNLGTQTLGFLRELTEAVDSVPHSVLVASVTASNVEDLQVLTEENAALTLAKMEDILRRVEDSRSPIEGTEIYDIIRARLFYEIDDTLAESTAKSYAEFYNTDPWRDLLPPDSRDAGYRNLLQKSYPFHPSIVTVLYERWGSRPTFQLTRGTLRFLSHLLAYLCQPDGQHQAPGALIHLSDVNLADADVRAEAIRVAGSEWEAIIGTDISAAEKDGSAIAQRIDQHHGGLYDELGLTEGIATCVFMFTHGGQQSKPTPAADIRLAVAQPYVPLPDFNQGFDDCKARLYYYYEEDGGYLFKTQPNPNKVLADERANISTDDARRQVEKVVESVVGRSSMFEVSYYGFEQGQVQQPGDVPDDGRLQMVVLPPRLTADNGRVSGKTAQTLRDIAENYGKKLRLNRNMILFLVPDSDQIADAIQRAIDWLAALRVSGDAGLMERFSPAQQDIIHDKATEADNQTKNFVRQGYNTVILPGANGGEVFELSYVPPHKRILQQAEEELLSTSRVRIFQEFNPELLNSRWRDLWPATATVITTEALWQKFARQVEAPILASESVLQDMIFTGVERELFGYGLLHSSENDKLATESYKEMYYGPFDTRNLYADRIEISEHTVLMRPAQIDLLFPPITKEEIAMLLTGSRQSVENVFYAARDARGLTVQGRVDRDSFFNAIREGVASGMFGYADSTESMVERGPDSGLTPDNIHFSGFLVGEDVPIPISANEVAWLVKEDCNIAIQELFQVTLDSYDVGRVTEQSFINALQQCVNTGLLGFAASDSEELHPGVQITNFDGYVGYPEPLPPDARIVQFAGMISSNELAGVMKTVLNLSKLGESEITLNLRLKLQGEVSEHAINTALSELRGRVPGLKVEDLSG